MRPFCLGLVAALFLALAPALPAVILVRNLVATVFARVSKPDDLMPLVYQVVLKKQDP